MEQLQARMQQAVQREVATSTGGDSDAGKRPLVRFGVAPNAPYTASRDLYSATLRLMVERGDRFCTHLAETEDERALLQVCEGEFIPFLEGMFPEGLPEVGCAASPVAYVAELLADVRPEVPKDATARFRVIRPPGARALQLSGSRRHHADCPVACAGGVLPAASRILRTPAAPVPGSARTRPDRGHRYRVAGDQRVAVDARRDPLARGLRSWPGRRHDPPHGHAVWRPRARHRGPGGRARAGHAG